MTVSLSHLTDTVRPVESLSLVGGAPDGVQHVHRAGGREG